MKKLIGSILLGTILIPIITGILAGIVWGTWLLGGLLLPYAHQIGRVLLGILGILIGMSILGAIIAGIITLFEEEKKN